MRLSTGAQSAGWGMCGWHEARPLLIVDGRVWSEMFSVGKSCSHDREVGWPAGRLAAVGTVPSLVADGIAILATPSC